MAGRPVCYDIAFGTLSFRSELRMRKPTVLAAIMLLALPLTAQAAGPISVVAAENFYGDVAGQIGGPGVRVTSILSNPDQDPHLFEASPSVARDISAAGIVVYSGIDYDPWMEKLLSAARSRSRRTIVVAPLAARRTGDNPHVWYDVETMLTYAAVLTEALAGEDPGGAPGYRDRLARFQRSVQPVEARIASLRDRLAGTRATATEPIFGYMFASLGMRSLEPSFQMSVMNGTEPSAADVAAMENDFTSHRVRLLVYNSQASDPVAARMGSLARAAGIPVVGATETEPRGESYQAWMTSELDAVDHALPR